MSHPFSATPNQSAFRRLHCAGDGKLLVVESQYRPLPDPKAHQGRGASKIAADGSANSEEKSPAGIRTRLAVPRVRNGDPSREPPSVPIAYVFVRGASASINVDLDIISFWLSRLSFLLAESFASPHENVVLRGAKMTDNLKKRQLLGLAFAPLFNAFPIWPFSADAMVSAS